MKASIKACAVYLEAPPSNRTATRVANRSRVRVDRASADRARRGAALATGVAATGDAAYTVIAAVMVVVPALGGILTVCTLVTVLITARYRTRTGAISPVR